MTDSGGSGLEKILGRAENAIHYTVHIFEGYRQNKQVSKWRLMTNVFRRQSVPCLWTCVGERRCSHTLLSAMLSLRLVLVCP